MAQLDAPSDWRPGGRGFNPTKVGNILSWRLIMKYFLRHSLPSADSRRAFGLTGLLNLNTNDENREFSCVMIYTSYIGCHVCHRQG